MEYASITVRYNQDKVRGITSPSYIRNSSGQQDKHTCTAMWDTAASSCMISLGLVEKLGLQPAGSTQVNQSGQVKQQPVYLIDIALTEKAEAGEDQLYFEKVPVIAAALSNCDMLIGLDIILRGDFAITTKDGPCFTFRVPGIETLDWAKDAQVDAIKKKHLEKGKRMTYKREKWGKKRNKR